MSQTKAQLIDNLVQPITGAAGSASAPTFSFTADPNTGIYSPGADQLAISTNGTGRLFIDSTGRVGVGTASPAVLLSVATAASGEGLRLTNGTNSERLHFYTGANALIEANNSNLALTARDANHIIFSTTNIERARFDSSGRLGLGTSSPSDPLHVVGNIRGSIIRSESSEFQFNGGNSALKLVTLNSQNVVKVNPAGYWGVQLVGANDQGILIDNSGRLGVGTTSPSTILTLDGATDPVIRVRRAGLGSTQYAEFSGTSGSANINGVNGNGGAIIFRGDGIERARIDTSGRLLVGTASGSDERQRVEHNTGANWIAAFRHTTTGSEPLGIRIHYAGATINNTAQPFLYCHDTTALRAEIRSNGGLANFSANNSNLSDRNSKKDISSAAGTWDCLKQWEIVNYRYKDQPDDSDLNLGVIAQQVAESCPEVVTIFEQAKDDQPEKLGVKEQQMYWMAIKALQEAQIRIEALETEVAALKAQ